MTTSVAEGLSGARRFQPALLPKAESGAPHALGVEVSTRVTATEWDAFVEQSGGTVEQLWAWREIYRDVFGHRCVYLTARRNSAIVGVLPLVLVRSRIFGRSVISLPFANYAGLLCADEEASVALVNEATAIGRDFRAAYIEFRNTTCHLPTLPSRVHKVGARLSLPATPDELFKALDRKVRNQIRKAQKEGVTVVRGGVELLDEFYGVFAKNMRDLGTPVFPQALFTDTLRRLPRNAHVFIARHGTVPVAAAIALAWRETVLVPWASSLRQHRHLNGNMLLYWSMLEFAIERGHTVFDFGRSTQGGNTHAFKQQWNPASFPLHWEYVLLGKRAVPSEDTSGALMRLLVQSWKRLPQRLTDVVGPLVTSHLK
jgi:serine/alanine adding enzyme